ncbi:MAG: ParB/RepB/Spo0J family partition protein [Clostridiales bacterium]|nr:ParB/RepB/Spo0J family partition protein [Clostridiales bacterium]
MAKTKKIGGLGKGLGALIPNSLDIEDSRFAEAGKQEVLLERIRGNPYQPRSTFDQEKLRELTESIREHGVIQPVLLRSMGDTYQLVAGERRFRAAKDAGLDRIPALIREMTESEMMEISLIENIQRQDLDPVEEARAYLRLSEEFGLTQEQIAKRVAKSRSYIANTIRLLHLPNPILRYLVEGKLTAGHLRPLLALNEENALLLANRFIEKEASVRDAEQWTRQQLEAEKLPQQEKEEEPSVSTRVRRQRKALSSALMEIQRVLREAVNTKVEIIQNERGGKIIIDYYTTDDIERILELIAGERQLN